MAKKELRIGGSKVEILPSGMYRVRIEIGGHGKRKQKSFTSDSVKTLTKEVAIWQEKREQELLSEKKGPSLTLYDAMTKYIETCEIAGRSPSTIVGYLKLQRISYADLKKKEIKSITFEDVQNVVNESAKFHSPKTVCNEYGFLHRVFSIYNPDLNLDKIILPTKDNVAEEEDKDLVIPTDQDIVKLLNAAQGDTELYIAILLGSLMGLRRSEICAIEWPDIDFNNKTLTISKGIVRDRNGGYSLKAPKSKKGRRILPIPPKLVEVLSRYRKEEGRVVEYTPDAITRRYEKIRDPLGLRGRFHDLRHYHCSIMIALNAPELYIIRDMGHSTSNMYKRVYGHMRMDKKLEIYGALGEQADGIIDSIKIPEETKI